MSIQHIDPCSAQAKPSRLNNNRMTRMRPERHDRTLLFIEGDPATSKITTEGRSHITALQHRRRQAESNRQNGARSGVKRLAFRPLAGNGDDGGAGETYTAWITSQQDSTSGQGIPLPSYHFVAYNPGKEPDIAVRRDMREYLARQQGNRRRGEKNLERSTSVDQLSNKPTIASKGLSSNPTTPTAQNYFDRAAPMNKSVPAYRGLVSPDEIIQPEQTASAPLLLRSLEDPNDQLNFYSRQLGTGVSTIWAYYLWQEREHGRLFHAQYEQFEGFGAKFLHPIILTDPAVLATTVLFTGCLLRQRFGHDIMTPAILHIKYLSYRLVQGSIDQSPQPGDATILAVLKLALFEAMFGQREAYQIHMQGLMRMLQLRNGLSALGLDGYLAHLLIWFDANLSVRTQTPRHLTGFVKAEESMQQADPDDASFALGININATVEE